MNCISEIKCWQPVSCFCTITIAPVRKKRVARNKNIDHMLLWLRSRLDLIYAVCKYHFSFLFVLIIIYSFIVIHPFCTLIFYSTKYSGHLSFLYCLFLLIGVISPPLIKSSIGPIYSSYDSKLSPEFDCPVGLIIGYYISDALAPLFTHTVC